MRLRRPAGPVEGAAGVELAQQARGRASFEVGIGGLPVANTRQGRGITKARASFDSPQVFTQHPRLRNEPGPNEPVNEWVPHLPGRIPPSGWDGEPGAASPTAGSL